MARLVLVLSLAWPALSLGTPAQNDILLVRSGDSSIYSQAIEAFDHRLEQLCASRANCPRTHTANLDTWQAELTKPPRLIVTLGHRASALAWKKVRHLPQLHIMVSETQHSLHGGGSEGVSAIFLEQPLKRQLDFVRFLLPDRRRVGVLLSEHSSKWLEILQTLTRGMELDLHVIEIDSPREIGKRLRASGSEIDVLLALPDPQIYNRETLAGILLTTYHDRIPVIGFSESMIRAGAIGGIYSSPKTIGTEAAQAALSIMDDQRHIDSPPSLLETRVNRRVADALNIRLPTESEIQRWKEDQ